MQCCIKCNKVHGNYEWTVVFNPNRPKGAPKKNYRIGVICPECESKEVL